MPLDLRPLTLGELFDRAFMLYRRHFSLFVGITAVPGVFALLITLAQQGVQTAAVPAAAAGPPDAAAALPNLAKVLWLFGGMMAAMVIYFVVYMIALGATTVAVSELYLGRSATIAHVYQQVRGRIGALVILLLLIGIRIGGVVFAGVLSIGFAGGLAATRIPVAFVLLAFMIAVGTFCLFVFMMLRYGLAIPALVLEHLPPRRSIRRSIELTRGRLGRVFLLVLCATLITYAALLLFQGPFLAGSLMAGLDTSAGFWLNVAGAVTGTIGTTLTTPFMIIGLALLYYDARIREEGLDLDLTLAALDRASGTARA